VDNKVPITTTKNTTGIARFDCQPAFGNKLNTSTGKKYFGYARGPRPVDFQKPCVCGHSWFPQCAANKKCPSDTCDINFRTFARLKADSIVGPWEAMVPQQPPAKEHQTYTMAPFSWHDISLAIVSVFEETTKKGDMGFVRSSLYYSLNSGDRCEAWSALGDTPGDDLIPLGEKGELDYGLIYAAPPVNGSFIYLGLNGEHYSPHNASFAVAHVDPDRFAGVRAKSRSGSATGSCVPLDVPSGRTQLLITADTAMSGASVAMTVNGELVCTAVQGRNVTVLPLQNCSLKGVSKVKLDITLSGGAVLYSWGFASSPCFLKTEDLAVRGNRDDATASDSKISILELRALSECTSKGNRADAALSSRAERSAR